MKTQQLFKKYVLLCESKKVLDNEISKLTSQIDELIALLCRTKANRSLETLDQLADKRLAAKRKLLEASLAAEQLDDIKKEILTLVEGIHDITFQFDIKIKEKTTSYVIKPTREAEIEYFVASDSIVVHE